MRTLDELINRDDPFMPLLRSWIAESARDVEVLDPDPSARAAELLALQVTTRSPLGSLAYETGGVLIDHGWLRMLGAGCPRLPRGLAEWNRLDRPRDEHRLPGALVIADDAVGGFFAINGGALPGPTGNIFYLAPDTCAWENLELGHTEWVHWALVGDLGGFYETLRWPGWEREAADLAGDRSISIVPFPWLAGEPIERRSRRPISVEETWDLHAVEFARALGPVEE